MIAFLSLSIVRRVYLRALSMLQIPLPRVAIYSIEKQNMTESSPLLTIGSTNSMKLLVESAGGLKALLP